MKKNYLFLALMFFSFFANAQTVSINEVTLGGLTTSTFQELPIDPV